MATGEKASPLRTPSGPIADSALQRSIDLLMTLVGIQHVIARAVLFRLVLLLVPSGVASVASAANDLNFEGISVTPLSRVVPGGVLQLQATVSNPGDSLAEGMIVVSIEEFPKLQSARRAIVEAGQHELLDVFVQIPETIQDFESLHLTASMVVRYGAREVILERNGAPARHAMTLDVGAGRTLGMAMQPDPLDLPAWYWPQASPLTDYEFSIAARLEAGHDRMAATFDERPFPLNDSSWAGLDLFVIADSSVLEDGAVVEAMRRYIASGGRLWIMLDLVPCALVRPLLEPNQLCEEIERVELNDFVVDHIGTSVQHSAQDRRVVSEADLPMARVVHEGGRVRFEVQGWPAAIEMNVGYGQIVLTTLDSRAWIEPRTKKTNRDARFLSIFQPRAWAEVFTIDTNEARSTLPLTKRVEYPLKHIGSPVVPRQWVAAVLLGFFASLAGLGLWLALMGRLSAIGLTLPVAAILVSISLISVANWMRRDIPESLSRFQIVEISSDGNVAQIREQAAVFLASAASIQLKSTHDGGARTSEAITTGIRRSVQEDFQKWSVANDAWPPGAWRYEAEYALPTEQLLARGSLSKTGLHLQLPHNLPWSLEDPVLSFSRGDPMLCDPSASGLDVNNQIDVEGDRWISSSFLSDEQQRRLELYRQFFRADNRLQHPTRRLYGWTPPWDGATWNRELKQLGSALVALPVALERPAIGSEVFVPHGLITLQRDQANVGSTSTFNDRSGKWREDNSSGAEAAVQFVLPPEVVPLAASAIVFELDIRAPQREVTLSVRTRSGNVDLVTLDSPSIPWTATITHAAVLEAARNGTLNVILKVSDSRNLDSYGIASNLIPWQIDHFHASVRGTVLAKSSLSSPIP